VTTPSTVGALKGGINPSAVQARPLTSPKRSRYHIGRLPTKSNTACNMSGRHMLAILRLTACGTAPRLLPPVLRRRRPSGPEPLFMRQYSSPCIKWLTPCRPSCAPSGRPNPSGLFAWIEFPFHYNLTSIHSAWLDTPYIPRDWPQTPFLTSQSLSYKRLLLFWRYHSHAFVVISANPPPGLPLLILAYLPLNSVTFAP